MTSSAGQDHATQDDLAAYAVSAELVDAAVAQHIAGCAQCGDVVHSYHLLEARLYRSECPDLTEMEAYAGGMLAGERQNAVERHTRDCPRCQSDLAVLRAVLPVASAAAPALHIASPAEAPGEPSPAPAAPSAWETVRRILATLLVPPATPAPAFALRGEVETYRAEDIEVTLRHDVDRGKFSLFGKIASTREEAGGQKTAVPPAVISVRLLKLAAPDAPPTLVAEVPYDQGFEFTGLFPGHYQLEVLLSDRLIVIASLVL